MHWFLDCPPLLWIATPIDGSATEIFMVAFRPTLDLAIDGSITIEGIFPYIGNRIGDEYGIINPISSKEGLAINRLYARRDGRFGQVGINGFHLFG